MGLACRHRPGLGAFCGLLRWPRQRPCAFCVLPFRRSAVLVFRWNSGPPGGPGRGGCSVGTRAIPHLPTAWAPAPLRGSARN